MKKKINLFKTREGTTQIINITKKEKKGINWIQVLNKTVTNPTDIANKLHNYFSLIAKKVEDKLITFDYSNYVKNRSEQSFFLRPANAKEALFEMKNLKSNKSTGPSSIPTKFLKFFKLH